MFQLGMFQVEWINFGKSTSLMNRKSGDLPNLLNALSANERRHFNLFSKAFSSKEKDPLYIQLFRSTVNANSELSSTDEKYTAEVSVKTKQRLYGNILKSLRIYYQEKSVDIIIQNLLSEVEILYKLSLPDQGLLLVNKAKALAETNEKFGLLLQVLEWEKRLNIVMDQPSRSSYVIVEEEAATLHKLSQIMALENIYSRAMSLKKQYGYAKGEARRQLEMETIKSPGMPTANECLSNKALFYYNFIYSLYHWMVFDHKEAYRYSKNLLNPGKNAILPNDFIGAILQHITSSVCLGYFNDALNGIHLGEAYIQEHKLNQSRSFNSLMFAYHATYEMIVYNYMGDYNKLIAIIQRTEEKLKQFDKVLTFELKQIIIGNLMNAYMAIGNLGKADSIWDSMFNRQSKAIRRDIYADLYLFRLFSLMASKTYILLPSAALSASKFYRKFADAKQVFEIELPISVLLAKERNYEKSETVKQLLEDIKKLLLSFINGMKNINGFQEHYSRYVIWIEAIIHDEPYHLAAARWHKAYSAKNKR